MKIPSNGCLVVLITKQPLGRGSDEREVSVNPAFWKSLTPLQKEESWRVTVLDDKSFDDQQVAFEVQESGWWITRSIVSDV